MYKKCVVNFLRGVSYVWLYIEIFKESFYFLPLIYTVFILSINTCIHSKIVYFLQIRDLEGSFGQIGQLGSLFYPASLQEDPNASKPGK